jgi:hypothetical protein
LTREFADVAVASEFAELENLDMYEKMKFFVYVVGIFKKISFGQARLETDILPLKVK